MDNGFIDVEAKSLYNVIETFEKKLINLSFVNDEILEKLDNKKLKVTLPENFLIYFKDIIKLNKLYEHTQIFNNDDDTINEEKEYHDDDDLVDNTNLNILTEHKELVLKIKNYCVNLCNIFNDNKEIFSMLNELKDKESHDFFKFLHIIKDLRQTFFDKFQTTAQTKFILMQSLEELKKEQAAIQTEEHELNDKLEYIRKTSSHEIKELELLLIKKEKEFNGLKECSEENIKKLLDQLPTNDVPVHLENINTVFEKTKQFYEKQVKLNQDIEVSLIKRNKIFEGDIQKYIDSIDNETNVIDTEIELLNKELEKNRLIAKNLDLTIKKKQAEKEEKEYLKNLNKKRNQIIEQVEKKNNDAAIIIQAYIRAVKERFLFSERAKKKPKKNQKK
ncbi:conserved protein, unknown function [Hepatocystis sp. ex Piliocolobus tephrosceles]|nr:conserved protein, unknown function [Hepatocystis sp. ex Piliocolobus tephrosceles]